MAAATSSEVTTASGNPGQRCVTAPRAGTTAPRPTIVVPNQAPVAVITIALRPRRRTFGHRAASTDDDPVVIRGMDREGPGRARWATRWSPPPTRSPYIRRPHASDEELHRG